MGVLPPKMVPQHGFMILKREFIANKNQQNIHHSGSASKRLEILVEMPTVHDFWGVRSPFFPFTHIANNRGQVSPQFDHRSSGAYCEGKVLKKILT